MKKSRLSPEVAAQVPSQCQKCPMLLWFDLTVQYEIERGENQKDKALSLLDEAANLRQRGELERADKLALDGRIKGEFSSWAADAEEGFSEMTELLVSNTDENCPGAKRVPITEGIFYSGDIVRGIRRYCTNPRFEALQSMSVNPNIHARLEEKWRPEG